MTVEVKVPNLGESVSEATIGKWLSNAGEWVERDQTLLILETDKVAVEVSAPAAGNLTNIVQTSGTVVKIGQILGLIDDKAIAAAVNIAAPVAPAPVMVQASQPAAMPGPAARKLLNEAGLSVSAVKGTGPGGRVTKSDVLDHIPSTPPAPSTRVLSTPPANIANIKSGENRVVMSRLRQVIAQRLKDAQNTAAILTTFNEVDMTAIMALRLQYKDIFEKKHGVKLGFMGFFTKAVTTALKEITIINACVDNDSIIYHDYCNIGIAVSTPNGLIVPVIRGCENKDLPTIEGDIAAVGGLARSGKLTLDQLQGGTFTITNGGIYGSLMSTPIINPPQSAIMGMHKIQDRPIALNGQVVVRPMMYLALSYDHRIIDGREAVTFLVRVKELLEDPQRLLLGI